MWCKVSHFVKICMLRLRASDLGIGVMSRGGGVGGAGVWRLLRELWLQTRSWIHHCVHLGHHRRISSSLLPTCLAKNTIGWRWTSLPNINIHCWSWLFLQDLKPKSPNIQCRHRTCSTLRNSWEEQPFTDPLRTLVASILKYSKTCI